MHTGLLPEYRGVKPEFWTLYHGEYARIGWTLHYMTPRLDAGDVGLRERVRWSGEDPPALRAKILEEAVPTIGAFANRVHDWGFETIPREPQTMGEGRLGTTRHRRGQNGTAIALAGDNPLQWHRIRVQDRAPALREIDGSVCLQSSEEHMRLSWRLVLALAGGLAACDAAGPTGIASPRDLSPNLHATSDDDDDSPESVAGVGIYRLQNAFDVEFAFAAYVKKNGRSKGTFRQRLEADGLVIDFTGRVTCLAFDAANNRAWVGGVITRNRSTDPAFTGAIFQPGHDVWFRVVDYGRGPDAPQPDRTTFLGFENNPTIFTSEQYCREKPWPADDARTWPVTRGGIELD